MGGGRTAGGLGAEKIHDDGDDEAHDAYDPHHREGALFIGMSLLDSEQTLSMPLLPKADAS